MESTAFYYEGERLVFLTEEDARRYFFKEELYHSVTLYFRFNEFLNNKGYSCEDVFLFEEKEKADILADYREALFECWIKDSDEVVTCDIYK